MTSIPFVDAAVDLDDQPEPVAGEIGEVAANRVLAAEAVSVDPGTAKALPVDAPPDRRFDVGARKAVLDQP
jgi:hypothetical protein